MLNTDQILKAGFWQAVAQKLGSFLCRQPPEVAPAVRAVGSSGAAAAPGEPAYPVPPVCGGSRSQCLPLPVLWSARCLEEGWHGAALTPQVASGRLLPARCEQGACCTGSGLWELPGGCDELWVQMVGIMTWHYVGHGTKKPDSALHATHTSGVWRVRWVYSGLYCCWRLQEE